MSDMTRYQPNGLQPIDPAGRGLALSIRFARQDDFPQIDALQKAENDKLGFMPQSAICKRIEQGNVLVAEAVPGDGCLVSGVGAKAARPDTSDPSSPTPNTQKPTPCFAGYCLGVDRYQKRSELGIIYQMAVMPAFRRCNVAGALLQAQFDKSAYGTRLYCCWCKQSLAANRFWESMGFVPLAFRAGARARSKKQAENPTVHVFWQKRIRVGDTETAWWYPYETQGGAMMEGRVVLPLPPEMRWDEAVPVVLPGAERRESEQKLLAAKVDEIAEQEKAVKKGMRPRKKDPRKTKAGHAKGPSGQDAKKATPSRAVMSYGFGAGSGFGKQVEKPTASIELAPSIDEEELARLKAEKDAARQALKAAQRKNDPELVAYARELRDRWQEHVIAQPAMIEDRQQGKYNVGRLLDADKTSDSEGCLGIDQQEEDPRVVKRLDAA